MKAAIYRRYGPPNVVQIADVPRPDFKTTEMLVKVRATTVTAGDSRLRSARVPRGFGLLMRLGFGIFGPRKPILGWELAGEVVAVGQSVSRFAPGDKVFAARMGCHAEYVAVPEDKRGSDARQPAVRGCRRAYVRRLDEPLLSTRQGADSTGRTGA